MDSTCSLCRLCSEDHDHLFFGCSFSKEVWSIVLGWCMTNKSVFDWNHELQWAVKKLRGKALILALLRLAWRSYIYHIWKERNARIFCTKVESSK